MIATRPALLLSAFLLLGSAPSPPALSWNKVDGAFFTVNVPGKTETKETKQTLDAIGEITTTEYVFDGNEEVHVSVNTSQFPAAFIQKSIPAKMLEGGRDGAIANVGGKLLSDQQVQLESGTPKKRWPGRIFTASLPTDLVLHQAVYLVDTTLLQIVYVAPKAKDAPKDFQRILDSLKLKKR